MTTTASRPRGPIVLEGRRLTRSFPGVRALDDVSFDVAQGEIHALLGENGAGKSTLLKLMTGVLSPDSGSIVLNDREVRFRNPHDARANGVTSVPQDVLFIPELGIGRNILLGLEPITAARATLSRAERRLVEQALSQVGARFGPDALAGSLSTPELRLAQIARFLVHPQDVLLLDEPTAVLSERDAEHLLDKLQTFRDEGRSIIYVTHRLSEVLRIADRVTVLREGRCAGSFSRSELSKDRIVSLMADRTGVQQEATASRACAVDSRHEAPVIRAVGLEAGRRLRGVSLEARAGCVTGVAGVQGSGHGVLLHALAGAERLDSGRVEVDSVKIRPGSVASSYSAGVVLVPGDRKGSGIVTGGSIRLNVVLTTRARKSVRRLGWRHISREIRLARDYIKMFGVRAPNAEALVGTLSGGNQQKVVLARALEASPRALLVEEPTQGIDINAKAEIRRKLRTLADDGDCAVVIATSEFEELLGLADVIHVMRLGQLVATLQGGTATYHEILANALP